MTTPKLKRCPFCGGTANAHGYNDPDANHHDVRYHDVMCKDCGCKTQMFESRQPAIAAWNRRAETNESNRWSAAIELLKTFSEQDLKDMKTLTEPSPFSFLKDTDRQESTGSDNSSPKERDMAAHEPGSGASTEPREFWWNTYSAPLINEIPRVCSFGKNKPEKDGDREHWIKVREVIE